MRNFFGGMFWEKFFRRTFFGRTFLEGFFLENFLGGFLGGLFGRNSLFTLELTCFVKILVFVKILGQ